MSDLFSPVGDNNLHLQNNEMIPCGFVKYTCEQQPRVTYINQRMIDILRIPANAEGELDYLEMYKSNIFLMIPMEDRRRFSKYLNRVYSSDTPVAGEMTVLRSDGTRARLFGWVIKCVNEHGESEFQSVCIDVTDRYQRQKETETRRYLRALADVYDKVFEFNLGANTVKCLHCEEQSSFKRMEGIAVRIEDALDRWVLTAVPEEERETVASFFRRFVERRLYKADSRPPQITYHSRSSTGEVRTYTGIFIRVDDSRSFYCCRAEQAFAAPAALQDENDHLKEGIRDLAMQFADGIAGFEISKEGLARPLYTSENAYEFFGYTREQWMELAGRYTPIEEFVARSDIPYEEIADCLARGEGEFPYYDVRSRAERRIKVICSPRRPTTSSTRFVMLYDIGLVGAEENKEQQETRTVFIRTFGYFDVFIDDRPIAFRNKKAKELLALLVDRRGGYVTSEEAIGFLWEDEPVNGMTLSRYRKVALRLKNTLEEYGIPDIVESVDGKRRVVMENVQCDLYNYLSGQEEYAQLFKGSYLTNYSWGETTLGELMSGQEHHGFEELHH